MPAVGGPEGDPVYDTAAIENEVSNVRASMSIRVFQKNTFFPKKIRLPPHVPLWGIYNPDPKAFFDWTSLEGQTT